MQIFWMVHYRAELLKNNYAIWPSNLASIIRSVHRGLRTEEMDISALKIWIGTVNCGALGQGMLYSCKVHLVQHPWERMSRPRLGVSVSHSTLLKPQMVISCLQERQNSLRLSSVWLSHSQGPRSQLEAVSLSLTISDANTFTSTALSFLPWLSSFYSSRPPTMKPGPSLFSELLASVFSYSLSRWKDF